ncbi:putative DNA repair/transcription protein [Taphrina deformans PYCC 5710]|uniref:MMS19 nucleotide excision repair protein n=1 Tax=Taphrina deformans (strain PYCC 5710 / ATCC 11124 / CBS 356.35 / IMI 108563 / JCM 9778 / NBRC 8474) TaxID=1097556 RepID=R4X873_TAPDE|nr:putative DNA repair/transcription protein [Taphrina deformans PYCC 5710]|eukprot:CCG81703.1 putative DNA repair/transcription protein [Taphrina deformans PYCC 5710]
MDGKVLVSEYLRAGINNEDESTRIITAFVIRIAEGRSSLLSLVSDLGDYLIEEDVSLRSKAMRLLEGVLGALPRDNLSGQHVTVMVQFFCDRLSDDACTMEALSALVSLSRMRFFAPEDADKVASFVIGRTEGFNNLPQRTRFYLYTLYERLMSTHRKALRTLDSQFVSGFMSLISGEKDPRNLMLAFSIMRIILAEFNIDDSIENIFDSVYCYFPITFRPQPNEPSTITTEDLKMRLRQCLSATPKFAPFLIPALIEKLNAVAVSVKKDTLLTLVACCDIYESSIMDTYNNELWVALKYELIQSEEDLLEEVVLQALRAVTGCFSRGLDHMPKSGSLSRWLQNIIMDTNAQLREPELKSAKPCGKILFNVAMASGVCLTIVIQAVLPGLIAICQESDGTDKEANLLQVILSLIEASSQHANRDKLTDNQDSLCLTSLKGDLLDLLRPIVINFQNYNADVQNAAVACLQNLIMIRGLLSDHEAEQIVKHFICTVIDGSHDKHNPAMLGLSKIATVRPQLILNQAFPTLLASLPDQADDLLAAKDQEIVEHILKCLTELSSERVIFNCLIVRVLCRIDACITANESCNWYVLLLLNTLQNGLKHFSGCEGQFYDKVVPVLCLKLSDHPRSELSSAKVLAVLSNIMNIIIRGCSSAKQALIANNFMAYFGLEAEPSSMALATIHFDPFAETCHNESRTNTISIFVAAVAGLRRDISIISKLDRKLIEVSLLTLTKTSDQDQRESIYVLMASLINKCSSESDVDQVLQLIWPDITSESVDNLELTLWIAKGLILRSHKAAKTLTDHIINLMGHAELYQCVADKFETLLRPHHLLDKENHANIKGLNKQKFYHFVVPRLVKELNNAPNERRAAYLTALSVTIANTPKAVCIADLTNVFPVLLQCVDLSSNAVKQSAITTILAIGTEGKAIVGSHLSTLVPSLLLCTEPLICNTPRVRIASLQLLGFLVELIRADKLQPYKNRIIRTLGNVLDDKRRLVRREAVLTRQKYFVAC